MASISTRYSLKQGWDNYILAVQKDEGDDLKKTASEEVFRKAEATNRWNPHFYVPPIVDFPDITRINHTWNSTNIDLSTHHTTVINTGAAEKKEKTQKEKDEEKATLAKYIGMGGLIFAAGALGYIYNSCKRYNDILQRTLDVKNKSLPNLPETPVKQLITSFVSYRSLIDELRANKINAYFMTCALFFVGAGSLAIGGCLSLPMMITAGKATVQIAAMFGAYQFFFHWNDEQQIRGYQTAILGNEQSQTIGLADHIRSELFYNYTEAMTEITNHAVPVRQSSESDVEELAPSSYQPLYSDVFNNEWKKRNKIIVRTEFLSETVPTTPQQDPIQSPDIWFRTYAPSAPPME